MTLQMLYLHWKTVRLGLLPFVLAAFGLPLLVARGLAEAGPVLPITPTSVALAGTFRWSQFFPGLAAIIGCLLALSAWYWDHRGNHVYALSLPITRQRYAMLKFSAGALLAFLPAAALLLGSGVAILSVDVPSGLNAYPLQLTARFLSGVMIVYAAVFALASGTIRTTVLILSALVGIPVLLSTGEVQRFVGDLPVDYWISLGLSHGPFRILFGNWLLFDA